MDLDAAADELYAARLDDFMARRTALANQAKAAGDKALAKSITALRKPTRSAWLVNLLARAEPDQLAGLVELGAELQRAQQAMDGDALRRLSKDRRTRIDALARRAGELGGDEGYAPPDGAIQEVSSTLQAALGDPAIAEVVQAGRLHQAISYGGFGPDDLASASVGDRAPSAWTTKRADKASPSASAEGRPRLSAVRERADKRETREAARKARAAADEAETAADEATTRADELADQVETLRDQLREAETAEREAREEARTARKHSTELRRAAAAAEQAAVRAQERR